MKPEDGLELKSKKHRVWQEKFEQTVKESEIAMEKAGPVAVDRIGRRRVSRRRIVKLESQDLEGFQVLRLKPNWQNICPCTFPTGDGAQCAWRAKGSIINRAKQQRKKKRAVV